MNPSPIPIPLSYDLNILIIILPLNQDKCGLKKAIQSLDDFIIMKVKCSYDCS